MKTNIINIFLLPSALFGTKNQFERFMIYDRVDLTIIHFKFISFSFKRLIDRDTNKSSSHNVKHCLIEFSAYTNTEYEKYQHRLRFSQRFDNGNTLPIIIEFFSFFLFFFSWVNLNNE